MGRLFTIFSVALLAGLAGSFLVAPWWAFFALNSAAEARDRVALAGVIDYPSVRANLDDQLADSGHAQGQTRPIKTGTLAAISESPDHTEYWVKPTTLYALSIGAGRPQLQTGPASALAPHTHAHVGWLDGPAPVLRYWSPSRVRLGVRIRTERDQIRTFTFRRTGLLSWCLTQVTLAPMDMLPTGSTAH